MKSFGRYLRWLPLLCWLGALQLSIARELSEAELVQLEEMANNMLAQLSPAERQQALEMAQRMEAELAQLPPEKLAEVEQALQQDVQYLLSEQSPYRPYAAPTPPLEPEPLAHEPTLPAPETEPLPDHKLAETAPKKPIKTVDPVQLKAVQDLLQTLIEQLDLLLLKTQALPRVSHDVKQEKRWQKLQPTLSALKAQLTTLAAQSSLAAVLLEQKYQPLYQALQRFSQALQAQVTKLTVCDTAGLKRWYQSSTPTVISDPVQKSLIQKFSAVIDQLLKLTPDSLQEQLQQLLKEFAPAASNYSPVGQRWHQADAQQQQLQQKKRLRQAQGTNVGSNAPSKKASPKKLAQRLTQEFQQLQQLLQAQELQHSLSSLAAPSQPLLTPELAADNANLKHPDEAVTAADATLTKTERKLRRKLESELIKTNLQYERLLRAISTVVEQNFQLTPTVVSDLKAYFNDQNLANQLQKLATQTQLQQAEFNLSVATTRQLTRLITQSSELQTLVDQLV